MQTEINQYKTRILQAIGLLVIGFLGFSGADLCAKLLQASGYSAHQVLVTSGTLGLLITGIWLLITHGVRGFAPPKLHLHLVRALSTCGTAYCMVSALKTLPLADFYGVVFISPFLLLIMSVLFLHEKVGLRRWLAVVVAFAGIIVLAGPEFEQFGEGFAYALGGAFFAALSVMFVRKIGHGAPLPLYGFYPFLFTIIINGVLTLIKDDYMPLRMEDAPVFLAHGPVIVLGIVATSTGYMRSPEASIVAPFMYTQIVWGVLFGWIFFGALPTETTIAGLILVIGAGCYSIWRDYKKAHDHHQIVPDIT